MSAIEQISTDLALLSKRVWDIRLLDDAAFSTLTQKVSRLSSQLKVQHVLQKTVQHLQTRQSITGLPNTQSRLSKFIENAYGKPDHEGKTNELRWQGLRGLDCEAFLLLAVSYTPLDIIKMHHIDFDYLAENAAKFLQVKALSQNWIFHKDIQVAITAKVELQSFKGFRKRYHELEFNLEASQGREPIGNPSQQPSLNDPHTTSQPIDSNRGHSKADEIFDEESFSDRLGQVEPYRKRKYSEVAPPNEAAQGPPKTTINTELEMYGDVFAVNIVDARYALSSDEDVGDIYLTNPKIEQNPENERNIKDKKSFLTAWISEEMGIHLGERGRLLGY